MVRGFARPVITLELNYNSNINEFYPPKYPRAVSQQYPGRVRYRVSDYWIFTI
jgi:hypothetical protein